MTRTTGPHGAHQEDTMTYIYLDDIPGWHMGHPEVLTRLAEAGVDPSTAVAGDWGVWATLREVSP